MLFVNKLKVLTLMTCLVLVGQAFATVCAEDYVAPENTVWDGTIATSEPCTKDGYYIIDNAQKLAWYAAKGSDSKWNWSRGNAKLTADIDLGGKLWTPIAAGKGGATEYTKTFDGNGHVVYNLYIKASELAQINKEYVQNLGFVGVLGGGTIKNLILENVNIQAATNAGSVNGLTTDNQISVGAVVGWMSEKGSSRVDTCMASGTIKTTGNGQGVGGIVGNAKKGTISNCLSLVEIHTSGSDSYVGGVIGITKTDVTVSSCVYAGPGLTNTGAEGLTGGIAGNVFTGKLTTNNNYFEGTGINGVGGTICKSKKNECTQQNATSAANSIANADAQKVDETNADNVACALNGSNDDGSCKEEPWSVGQTGLSLNGYGADGYKIIFNANGGAFAGSAVTKNIYLASGMAITDNEVGKPSRNGFSFEGWAATADATESLENLGTVSKSTKFYAVWAPLNTIIFNVAPGSFSLGEQSKTKQVANGEVITVEGLGALPTARCKKYVSGTEDECETWSYFTGWALTEGALESDSVSLDTVTASNNLVLYAVWTDVETYTVTYNANRHGKTTVDYVRVGDGESVEEPSEPVADNGYVFAGWYTDEEGNSPYEFSSKIHENLILYAKWALQRYSIVYVKSEGSDTGDNPSTYTIDTAFVLNAPASVEGYVFEGWFYDANFTQPASQVILGSTGDKTFYAKWTKKTYRIMYLADNNSQGAVTDQFKEHGLPITLASAGYFNRKGYGAQIGWAIEANGEKVYEFGATYENNAALTLYPAWGPPIEYTITYVCDVCTGDNPDKPNPHTYTVNDTKGINLPIYNPTYPDNYDFKGWYWDKAYTKRTTNIPMDTVGNLTLYGKTLKYYYLAYELYGSTKANNPEKYTIEQTFTLKDPAPRAGYTFGGWYTEDTFVNQIAEIQLGSSEDMTLHAKWIPNTYTVSYDAGGFGEGSIENGTKTHDVDFVLSSETFTRAGYTQDGWEDVNGDVVSSPYTENADITLYPHWVINTYTVTYDAGEFGDGSIAAGTKTHDVDFELSAETFTRTGYTQVGWEDVNGDIVSSPYTENADITLYPHWVAVYTITYALGDDEGVTGEVTAGTKIEGEDATLSSVGFTREGYTQTGWKTEDGSVTYAMGATYTTDASVTLYPIWLKVYTITYELNGGTNAEGNPDSYTSNDLPITLLEPTKSGSKFEGWYYNSDFSGDRVDGIYTVGSDDNITLYAHWLEYPILVKQSGGVKILLNENGKTTAEIDGSSMETINIDKEIEVSSVSLDREFPVGKYATIVLPFSIAVDNVHGGNFYSFTMEKDENGAWVAKKDAITDELVANTPYLIEATSAQLTFDGSVTLVPSDKMNDVVTVNSTGSSWTFKGTYQYHKWVDGDDELGSAYGFVGQEKPGFLVGQFVKIGQNTWIRPMRGYLLYTSAAKNRRKMLAKSLNVARVVEDEEDLPDVIDVISPVVEDSVPEEIDIVSTENEETTVVGSINTVTGEIKMFDRWYDMNGRRLNAKPTAKGIYYFNGKKVMVK